MTAIPVSSRGKRLTAVILILLAGVTTGAQLGKIAPLIPWYQAELGLPLVAAGWLASILGIFIATAALPTGWVIARIGVIRGIAAGVAIMFGGGMLLAFSSDPVIVFSARLIEAVGYLILCVALPSALNAICPPSWKGPVLAIWSGFVPLGFALADLMANAITAYFSPRVFLFTLMVLFGLFSAATLCLLRGLLNQGTQPAAISGRVADSIGRNITLNALSFASYVVLTVSYFNFLPVFISSAGAHFLLPAGAITLAVPIGNILASISVRGRSSTFIARLTICGFLVGTATIVPALTSQNALVATSCAILAVIAGAVVASAHFALVPFLTPERGSTPMAFGMMSQMGGIGTMFGPPLAAGVIDAQGWAIFAYFLVAFGVLGAAFMVPLSARSRSRHP